MHMKAWEAAVHMALKTLALSASLVSAPVFFLLSHIHFSIIYPSQDIETTWVSITRWMDKDNVTIDISYLLIYLMDKMEFIHKKEGSPAICNNMDIPWGHYAKWNKSASTIPSSTPTISSNYCFLCGSVKSIAVARYLAFAPNQFPYVF